MNPGRYGVTHNSCPGIQWLYSSTSSFADMSQWETVCRRKTSRQRLDTCIHSDRNPLVTKCWHPDLVTMGSWPPIIMGYTPLIWIHVYILGDESWQICPYCVAVCCSVLQCVAVCEKRHDNGWINVYRVRDVSWQICPYLDDAWQTNHAD